MLRDGQHFGVADGTWYRSDCAMDCRARIAHSGSSVEIAVSFCSIDKYIAYIFFSDSGKNL